MGNVGKLKDLEGGAFEPSPFTAKFLDFCKRESVPLDFFSWHNYAKDPRVPAAYARGVRDLLDRTGFPRTESHLTEWNYLPDDNWMPLLRPTAAPREKFYDRIGGAEGAAFTAWL